MIKCNGEIMRAFENQLNDIETGYNANGAVSISQLEKICHAVSKLGLEKYAKSKATLKQNGFQNGYDFVFNCPNGSLNINSAAIYMCAFFIKAGLHPLLIYSSNYVFVGVWVKANQFFEVFGEHETSNAFLIKNAVYPQKGDLFLIDSWNAINGKYNFWNGSKYCEEKIPSVKRIFDFDHLNNGNPDCIILDESPYRTSKQTRMYVSQIISSRMFSSDRPSRDFRNVHFFDMSQYDMSVSDMIQQNNSYFIKNINTEKQITLAVDSSLNMCCQGKNVLLVCDEDILGNISIHMENIGLKANHGLISMEEYEDYIDIDDDNGWEILKSLFLPKKKDVPSPPKKEIEKEPVKEYEDIAFTDGDMAEFFSLADKQKILSSIPDGSNKTLLDIWKDYYENHSAENELNKDAKRTILPELDKCIEQHFEECEEILKHLKKFADLRAKCLLDLDGDTFDFVCFNDGSLDIDEFVCDVDRIYESQKNLDGIYYRISSENENRFCFEDMMKYKEAFEKLLGICDCGKNIITYREYLEYLDYKNNKKFFSGGDVDECLGEYTADELDIIIKDIETAVKPSVKRFSQNSQTAKSNVYSLLKRIVPSEYETLFSPLSISVWNNRHKNEILSSFKHLVSIRKNIFQNFDVLKNLNEIFRENVNEDNFDRQCSWFMCYNVICKNSAFAEEIARNCCLGANEIRSNLEKYINDYNNSIKIEKILLKYISQLWERIHSNIYRDYLSEREILIQYGIKNFIHYVDESDSTNSIDETLSCIEKYLIKIRSLTAIRNANADIQEIPYIHELYKRMLNDLKQHYYYLITNEQPDNSRFLICTPSQTEKYKTLSFDKLIICETEKIPYSFLECIMENIGCVIFMSESQEFSKDNEDSVASLMDNNLNPFDYSLYGSEEH